MHKEIPFFEADMTLVYRQIKRNPERLMTEHSSLPQEDDTTSQG